MKQIMKHWLIVAHNTFPISFKYAARGAISGSFAGFMLSFIYSMLFGIPFSVIGTIVFFLGDTSMKGMAKVGNSLLLPITVIGLLIFQCVLPSVLIGAVSGTITGLGVKVLNRRAKKFTVQTGVLIGLFWTAIAFILLTFVVPYIFSSGLESSFDQSIFLVIPSAIAIGAMIYVARVSSSPMIKFMIARLS